MHFTSSTLAAVAFAGLAVAAPGGWGNGGNGWGYGGGGWGEECKTSSSCKPVYSTETDTYSKPETTVIATTVYKPETITYTSESTEYSTIYSMSCLKLMKEEELTGIRNRD
jgi:hypothetical protein